MEIRCSCGKGHLVARKIDRHDVGELVGPFAPGDVVMKGAPGFVCSACGEVTFTGEVIGAVARSLVNIIVARGEKLRPREVAFLRGELAMTQAELAERLGTSRNTVARWESEEGNIGRADGLALRALVAAGLGDTKLLEEIAAPKRPHVTQAEVPYQVAV